MVQKLGWDFVRDLALDANDTPHITYGSLAYAAWNKIQWEFQTIATDDTAYSSIALDSSGIPHVAYSIDTELRYARQNGSNWTIQIVDDMPDIARRVSCIRLKIHTLHNVLYCKSSAYQTCCMEELQLDH